MPNVADQLQAHLRSSHSRLLEQASAAADKRHVRLYLAGGAVRDVLLGITPGNLDIVLVRPQADFGEYLAERVGGEVTSRSQFGTYKLLFDGDEIDVATARREEYLRPGALPIVEAAGIEEDLGRRDSSINSMAVSLDQDSWGELLDLHGGRGDLGQGVVRTLHDDSFVDDATRILRAVRYAVRLGFRIEAQTHRLLKRDLVHLDDISGDRVRHELERMLTESLASDVLRMADEEGVLSAIHPGLRFGGAAGTSDSKDARAEDVALAMLVYFSSDAKMGELGARLNMDSRWSRTVREVRAIKSSNGRLAAQDVSRRELFALLRDLQPAVVRGCVAATDDPAVKGSLELYLTELRDVRPTLNGDDLLALGVPEGPLVGELLDKILAGRLEGLLSTREDEKTLVVNSLTRSRD